MAKTKESKLEEEIEKLMQKEGIWQLARYQAQSNQNGLPDRLYLYKGILLGLELKTDKGKPTKLQIKKIGEINNNGGIGLFIRNVETVRKLIELIDDFYNIESFYTVYNVRKEIEKWMDYNEY